MAGKCPICGETDPFPASICLPRLAGDAEPNQPCSYGVEGSEREEDATPHTLRHTAATWLMQEGADIWQAAGFLGMTTKTLGGWTLRLPSDHGFAPA